MGITASPIELELWFATREVPGSPSAGPGHSRPVRRPVRTPVGQRPLDRVLCVLRGRGGALL